LKRNKSSTFLSGYCTPQEGYIEPFIPAASCGVFWKVLDKFQPIETQRLWNKIFEFPRQIFNFYNVRFVSQLFL